MGSRFQPTDISWDGQTSVFSMVHLAYDYGNPTKRIWWPYSQTCANQEVHHLKRRSEQIEGASTGLMAGVFRIFVKNPLEWRETCYLGVYGCLWDLSIKDSSQQRRPCSQQGRGVLTSFYYQGVKLSDGTFIFLLWSKRGKLNINMTNLKFPNNWTAKLL